MYSGGFEGWNVASSKGGKPSVTFPVLGQKQKNFTMDGGVYCTLRDYLTCKFRWLTKLPTLFLNCKHSSQMSARMKILLQHKITLPQVLRYTQEYFVKQNIQKTIQYHKTLEEAKQNKLNAIETIDNRKKPWGLQILELSDTNCKATMLTMFKEINV